MNKWLTTSVKPDKLTCGSCGYEEDIGWVGEEGTKYCPGCGEDMHSTDLICFLDSGIRFREHEIFFHNAE